MWKRPLGEGYSSPVVENGVLYTMYGQAARRGRARGQRRDRADAVGAGVADDVSERRGREMGNGPYATPLIVGDRLFTTGVAGRLQCLDKKTGKVLWTQQLWADTAARG